MMLIETTQPLVTVRSNDYSLDDKLLQYIICKDSRQFFRYYGQIYHDFFKNLIPDLNRTKGASFLYWEVQNIEHQEISVLLKLNIATDIRLWELPEHPLEPKEIIF